MHTERHIIKIL